jgi:uncharacterized protein (DUF58 family)
MGGDYWLFLGIVVLIIGVTMHQVPLIIFTIIFLLGGGLSRLWNRFCLHRIEYRRSLSQDRVFLGDEVVFEVEVANHKPLPLPWLRLEDELPAEVNLLKGKTVSAGESRAVLSNIFPLNWYHRVKRRFPIQCLQRGCFVFGPTRISSGDLFGFFHREKTIDEVNYLTVYPRIVPLEILGIPSRQLFGDIRVRSHLFQDPVLTAGVREYQPGDSLKRIHWKSTARIGRLQTRLYEPTTTTDVMVFLDVRTMPAPYWGSVKELLELAIVTAASFSREALGKGYRVGLLANQVTRFSREMIKVPHSRHNDQLLHILDALAQLHETETMPMSGFIQQEARNLPWGSTLVVITAQPGKELLEVMLDLKRVGRSLVLIKVGGLVSEFISGEFPVYHVSDPVNRDQIEKIDVSLSSVA